LIANSGRSPEIAIIGAGWAGLATAISLARRGASVSVFEASRIPGGRARRVEVGGQYIDNGQHILLGAYTETLNLIESVSPGSTRRNFLRIPLTLDVPGQFRLIMPKLPAPFGLIIGLMTARGLNFNTKFAMARLMRFINSPGIRIPSGWTVEKLLADQTDQAIKLVWTPLCLSALNTPPNKASAEVFVNVLRDAIGGPPGNSDMLLPRVDLTSLFADPAIKYLLGLGAKLSFGIRIDHIGVNGKRITLSAGDRQWAFDTLVLASAPHHASKLLADIDGLEPTKAILDAVRYQPIVTTYLDYPESVRLPSPIIGLNDPAAHFAFDHRYTHNHPGRLAVVASAEHSAPAEGREGRVRHIHQVLERALGPLAEPTGWKIIEEKRATFECSVSLARPENHTEHPNIFLAGDFTQGPYPATLEGAVRSGVQCAQTIWSHA
jgi:squalene-associated FAD-dependent desaturase